MRDWIPNDEACSICFDDLDAALISSPDRLPCSHIFHEHCLSEWFKQNGSCPICRSTPRQIAEDVAADVAGGESVDEDATRVETALHTLLKILLFVLLFVLNVALINVIFGEGVTLTCEIFSLVGLLVVDCCLLRASVLLPKVRSCFCNT